MSLQEGIHRYSFCRHGDFLVSVTGAEYARLGIYKEEVYLTPICGDCEAQEHSAGLCVAAVGPFWWHTTAGDEIASLLIWVSVLLLSHGYNLKGLPSWLH